jgi:hypothetical protein
MEQDENKSQDVAVPDQIVSGAAVTGQEKITDFGMHGDLIFYLYNRQDRISDRLNKKIGRPGLRLTAPEKAGAISVTKRRPITRQIRERGEMVSRVSVKRTHYHHYNISVRMRTLPKELRPVREPVPVITDEEEGVA